MHKIKALRLEKSDKRTTTKKPHATTKQNPTEYIRLKENQMGNDNRILLNRKVLQSVRPFIQILKKKLMKNRNKNKKSLLTEESCNL